MSLGISVQDVTKGHRIVYEADHLASYGDAGNREAPQTVDKHAAD